MDIIRCGNGGALQGSDLPRVTPLSKWQSSCLTQAVCSSISLSVRTHYSQLCPQAGPQGGTLTFLTFSQSSACSDASLFLKLSGDASPGNILTRAGGVELSDFCARCQGTQNKSRDLETRQICEAGEFPRIHANMLATLSVTLSLECGLSRVTCFWRWQWGARKQKVTLETSPEGQWIRLLASKFISDQGTRSRMLQLRPRQPNKNKYLRGEKKRATLQGEPDR